MSFLVSIMSITLIDLILSGDNAVVIALACRKLPADRQKKAVMLGTIGAVSLRVLLTMLAAVLLKIPCAQFVGGLALLYIAASLGNESDNEPDCDCKQASSLWGAVKTILVADFIMSLDNVLAIAALADGSLLLLILGLGISIPIVVFGSQILMKLMNRYSIIIYIGMAILSWTAAKMIVEDAALGSFLLPYALQIKVILTVGVVGMQPTIMKKIVKQFK